MMGETGKWNVLRSDIRYLHSLLIYEPFNGCLVNMVRK